MLITCLISFINLQLHEGHNDEIQICAQGPLNIKTITNHQQHHSSLHEGSLSANDDNLQLQETHSKNESSIQDHYIPPFEKKQQSAEAGEGENDSTEDEVETDLCRLWDASMNKVNELIMTSTYIV